MIVSAGLVAIGQLLWKMAGAGNETNWLYLIFGTGIYGFATLCMMAAFRFGRLSVLQPMLSLAYVFSPLLGLAFLGEVCSTGQYIGMGVMIAGVICMGVGDAE